MMNKLNLIYTICVVFLLFQSCNQNPEEKNLVRFLSPTAGFAVDESFRPIVDEELYIFKALYPTEKPTMLYGTENTAVDQLLNDSVRIAILGRDLTKEEYKQLATRNLNPVVGRFAIDAVALIVNQTSNDTLITVSEIKQMLKGNIKPGDVLVFDNPNSGLVSYLKRFSGNKELGRKNVYALKSNKDVINYVSQHPNAIGITGFSWLNDPDKDYADAVAKVKIMSVRDENSKTFPGDYFTPSQNTLALKQYPLTRDLFIYNCTGNYGLGMKFASFLGSDRGQRIILKSGLLPDDIPARRINIVAKIKQ